MSPSAISIEKSRRLMRLSMIFDLRGRAALERHRRTQQVSLSGLAGRKHSAHPSLAQHDDPIGEADQLRQLARDQDHAETTRRELTDERVDLALGADVDA